MNRNVTASFGLSVLTVLFFAVALYQPDPPPAPPPRVEASRLRSSNSETSAGLPIRPVVLPTVATKPRPARVVARPPLAAKPSAVSTASDHPLRAPAPPRTAARPAERKPPPRQARGGFTECRAGESLADVAQRVYGSTERTQALWLANRDVLDRADARLAPGTLLRTP